LPKVKRFLKEAGGVDAYPKVELEWIRGHDPVLEVRECTGAPPSADVKPTPIATISLAPFNTEELHYLLQCNGFVPSQKAPLSIPRLDRETACQALPEVKSSLWWWMMLCLGFTFWLPLLAICRWCPGVFDRCRWCADVFFRQCASLRAPKSKLEDSEMKRETAAMIGHEEI